MNDEPNSTTLVISNGLMSQGLGYGLVFGWEEEIGGGIVGFRGEAMRDGGRWTQVDDNIGAKGIEEGSVAHWPFFYIISSRELPEMRKTVRVGAL